MKITHVGVIATAVIMALGAVMVIPYFMHQNRPQTILLSFNIVNDSNLPDWCNGLASVLKKYQVEAGVFVVGKIAQNYPECVSVLPNNVDVGSQTYDYVNLTSIPDYTIQLEEIKNGKLAVDLAGNLDSRLFKAPHGFTDGNIYSLLNRSGIYADFSYDTQYNKYYNGKFIEFSANSFQGNEHSADFFRNMPTSDKPIIINFDNSTPIEKIDDFIEKLKSVHTNFVNASDLTGINLTKRQGEEI